MIVTAEATTTASAAPKPGPTGVMAMGTAFTLFKFGRGRRQDVMSLQLVCRMLVL